MLVSMLWLQRICQTHIRSCDNAIVMRAPSWEVALQVAKIKSGCINKKTGEKASDAQETVSLIMAFIFHLDFPVRERDRRYHVVRQLEVKKEKAIIAVFKKIKAICEERN